jgi:hypothetical protein
LAFIDFNCKKFAEKHIRLLACKFIFIILCLIIKQITKKAFQNLLNVEIFITKIAKVGRANMAFIGTVILQKGSSFIPRKLFIDNMWH